MPKPKRQYKRYSSEFKRRRGDFVCSRMVNGPACQQSVRTVVDPKRTMVNWHQAPSIHPPFDGRSPSIWQYGIICSV